MNNLPAARRGKKPKPLTYGDGSIFQRKTDSRWIVRVRQNGKRVQIGSSTTEDAAREILDTYNERLDAGLKPEAEHWLTVAWMRYWLETKQPRYDQAGRRIKGVEPSTWEKYEIQVRNHIEPYVGSIIATHIVDVRAEQIERWQQHLHRNGVKADTQREALMRLSTALELAVGYDYIPRNPTKRIERPDAPRREHVQPSELDLIRLLRAIKDQPLEVLVWIALGGGLRRGEVGALQCEDVAIYSDDHGVIRAHRRRNRIGRIAQTALNLDSLLEREGLKSEPERHVDIGGKVIEVLRHRWAVQVAQRQAASSAWTGTEGEQPSGYLFTDERGAPLTVEAISLYMSEVRHAAGLDIDRFHELRRVFTTLLSKAGVHDRVTMELAGHKDLKMTHYYQQPMASQKREAAQALDVILRQLADG
jgi:integrase